VRRSNPKFYLTSLLLCGCSVPVAQGLEDQEANQAVVTLQRGGIAANKEPERQGDNRFQVTVARTEASFAVALLAEEGPAGRKSQSLLESLNGTSALIPSPRSEEARLLAGTAGELERSLQALDGVLSARVHLAAADRDPLREPADTPQNTAAVLIRYRDGQTPISPLEVARVVSGAVSGLSPERVNVVLKSVAKVPSRSGLARLGPLSVSQASVAPLRWILGTALLTNVLLAFGLVWLWRRLRTSQS